MSHHVNTNTLPRPLALSSATAVPAYYRLTSLARLPGKKGPGIYNEATLYHPRESLRVCWTSNTVDSRLRRGDIVTVRDGRSKGPRLAVLPVLRIRREDRPMAAVNPFDLVPPSWVKDCSLTRRAAALWERLERPLQQLVNAALWDGARFYRFVTGPVSAADYPGAPAGNFRRSVALAEEALSLADGLPNVARGVLLAAALLQDAGKADAFRLAPDGSGIALSERGRWIGYQQTVLEWLAVARTQVIVPDTLYLHLVHVLLALHRPPETPLAIETAILNVARGFIDSPQRLRDADRLISRALHPVR